MDKITEIDGQILIWIQEHIRTDILTPIVKAITYLGEMGGIWILFCVGFLIFPKTRRLGMACSLSLAMVFLVDNVIIKNLVARTRPYEVVDGLTRLVGKQHDYSFPSGHSGASFAVAWVMFREMPKKFGIPAVILALLIALSRLYVGVHYPTDVLVGTIMGIIMGIISCKIMQKVPYSKK